MNPIKEANTNGLAYGEMARRIGLTRQYVTNLANLENPDKMWGLPLKTAYKFKDILGIDIEKYLVSLIKPKYD